MSSLGIKKCLTSSLAIVPCMHQILLHLYTMPGVFQDLVCVNLRHLPSWAHFSTDEAQQGLPQALVNVLGALFGAS